MSLAALLGMYGIGAQCLTRIEEEANCETDDGLKKLVLLADISLFASTIFVGLLLWRRSRTREEAKVEDVTRRISHTNPLSEVEDDEGES